MARLFPLFLATMMVIAASPSHAEDADDGGSIDDIPHITIAGTAETEVTPDIAAITLGVTTEKPTASAAAAETTRKAKTVIDVAKAEGVAPADIATQSVTLTQTFDDLQDSQGRTISHKPRGFMAANVITIKMRDLTKVGTLAETLIEKGANRFDGIEFSVDHPEPILDRLTGEAVARARTQAQVAAEAAGARLGRILRIQKAALTPFRLTSSAQFRAAEMPIEAGTKTFSAQIEATWALDAK